MASVATWLDDANSSPWLARLTQLADIQVIVRIRQIAWRYFKASHRDDPGRTVLELLLVFFVIRMWMQSRTRSESSGRNFVKLSEREIEELITDWQPEPLISSSGLDGHTPPTIVGAPTLHSRVLSGSGSSPSATRLSNAPATGERSVINLASANFSGLVGNERIKEKAIECLHGYGVGSCGPPGFYGTFDVHLTLEKSLAEFLGVEAAILYAQGFSTISSVIPTFAKRGDIVVADRGCNFAIQRGIQISRCNVYWYEHNDMDDLERVLRQIDADFRKSKRPLTRRFIISEGLFEIDGQAADLPRILELKYLYNWSFGVLGATGRGLTELFDVPGTDIDILVGSLAIGLCAAGGFCAGADDVVRHQRINSPACVYSASLPPMMAVSSTEALFYLTTPTFNTLGVPMLPLAPLDDNVLILRSMLDKLSQIDIPSDPLSPLIHFSLKPSPDVSLTEEARILQDVVDEALNNGVLLTRAMVVAQHEMNVRRPSIRICVSAALSKKECEKAAGVIKAAVSKISKRR